MNQLIAFFNMFLSYLLVFVIFAAAIILAVTVGIKCRKEKNKKDAVKENESQQTNTI